MSSKRGVFLAASLILAQICGGFSLECPCEAECGLQEDEVAHDRICNRVCEGSGNINVTLQSCNEAAVKTVSDLEVSKISVLEGIFRAGTWNCEDGGKCFGNGSVSNLLWYHSHNSDVDYTCVSSSLDGKKFWKCKDREDMVCVRNGFPCPDRDLPKGGSPRCQTEDWYYCSESSQCQMTSEECAGKCHEASRFCNGNCLPRIEPCEHYDEDGILKRKTWDNYSESSINSELGNRTMLKALISIEAPNNDSEVNIVHAIVHIFGFMIRRKTREVKIQVGDAWTLLKFPQEKTLWLEVAIWTEDGDTRLFENITNSLSSIPWRSPSMSAQLIRNTNEGEMIGFVKIQEILDFEESDLEGTTSDNNTFEFLHVPPEYLSDDINCTKVDDSMDCFLETGTCCRCMNSTHARWTIAASGSNVTLPELNLTSLDIGRISVVAAIPAYSWSSEQEVSQSITYRAESEAEYKVSVVQGRDQYEVLIGGERTMMAAKTSSSIEESQREMGTKTFGIDMVLSEEASTEIFFVNSDLKGVKIGELEIDNLVAYGLQTWEAPFTYTEAQNLALANPQFPKFAIL